MNSEGFKIGSVCVEERREVQCHSRSTLTWSLSADHDCQNNEWKADKILKLGWRAVEQRLSHLNLIILPGFIYSGWTCRFPAEPQREALRWESEPLWTMMKTELSFFLLLTDSLLPSEASSLLSPLHQSHASSFLQAAWGAARKTAAFDWIWSSRFTSSHFYALCRTDRQLMVHSDQGQSVCKQ